MKQGANRSDINRINELHEQGLTPSEISAQLLIVEKYVRNHLPAIEEEAEADSEEESEIGLDLD